ncbi:MAG: DDE-type integrase/transposase/recombinase [Ardenticatenaceae bacterium]|nr:DDE-type integrase/transposase/recombinase [Anaerolineales bacterium]MCB8919980.1 DDE-type integrase/transposase/recombinase [Ardenticatenaceae bacterium]MCB8989827.1 DDE-type integrase/transposase/recombinase [Ardenticatenaceae bacterium]
MSNRFSSGTYFHMNGTVYQVKNLLKDSKLNIEKITTGEIETTTITHLITLFFDGELEFIEENNGNKVVKAVIHFQDIGDCSNWQREVAKYRLWVIKPFLDSNSRTIEAVKNRVEEVKSTLQIQNEPTLKREFLNSVSVTSIYKWIHLYTLGELRALVPSPNRGGKGKGRLSNEVEFIIQTVIDDIYMVRESVPACDVVDEVMLRIHEENAQRDESELLKAPSERTIHRRVEQVDNYKKSVVKKGKKSTNQERKQFGIMIRATRPFQRLALDTTTIDNIILDDETLLPLGRACLTFALDEYAEYPGGFYLGFEPPSYLTTLSCLAHTMRPKPDIQKLYGTKHGWISYGIPASIWIDNAKEFIGNDLRDSCYQLGIDLSQVPFHTPHLKPQVERFFGTMNTGLIHKFGGTTFSSIHERGNYNSVDNAVLTYSFLQKMIVIFLIDFYAEQFHRGINSIPARRWEEALAQGFSPRLPRRLDDINVLLGRTQDRKIWHYGVDLFGLRYNCDDLSVIRTNLKKEKAKIKYDPADLSSVHVLNPVTREYLEVPALATDYATGLSLWQHNAIKRYARENREKVDIYALAETKRVLRELAAESMARKKLVTRKRAARFAYGGKSGDQIYREQQEKGNDVHLTGDQEDSSLAQLNNKDLDLNLDNVDHAGWSLEQNDSE